MQATWRQFFFSPSGRFTRSQYWGATLSIYGLLAALGLLLFLFDPENNRGEASDTMFNVYVVVFFVVFIIVTVSHIFAVIKRFHDRNKPWPWCLIALLPYIGGIWILVECGCLEGTPGSNDYGPSSRPSDVVDRV